MHIPVLVPVNNFQTTLYFCTHKIMETLPFRYGKEKQMSIKSITPPPLSFQSPARYQNL